MSEAAGKSRTWVVWMLVLSPLWVAMALGLVDVVLKWAILDH